MSNKSIRVHLLNFLNFSTVGILKAVVFSLLLSPLVTLLYLSPNLSHYSNNEITLPPKAAAISSTPSPTTLPFTSNNVSPPVLTAQAVYALDLTSNSTLHEHNSNVRLMPASTTKIMTALIALESYSLTDVITITQEDSSIGQTMKLVKGEQLTVLDLLYGALVSSGNDAALALALSSPLGGYSQFVDQMNQKAESLGLANTHFTNVSGVEDINHISSARDIAVLTSEALKNATFSSIVSTKIVTVTSIDGKFTHRLTNTNTLLGTLDGVVGVKTGWTEHAGECLVTLTNRNNRQIITVILNSQDRFNDSKKLIEWLYSNYNFI